ncbi:acetyl-CoA synthetase-like protein [Rhizodiscina lignyota]|uniref:Acetyl-CoA synthetase-like protein n=1 Tax=Rhizodiscina lignyota TaxID=1504668 RepID=A0A9P4M266_9PEZI|nr:acetyl-CoA synthetase-like protein [Rhizodiscina lignyota]
MAIESGRLLPVVVDEVARKDPSRVWASVPKEGTTIANGFRDITFKNLAAAINHLCWHLGPKLGQSTNYTTVAYFGPADPSWHIVMLSLAKLGFKLLCSAGRNSLQMHLNLMEAMDCHIILHAPGQDIKFIADARPMRVLEIPSLMELLNYPVAPAEYSFTKKYEDIKFDPLVVLHTSGSTGMPKPIVLRYEYSASADRMSRLEPFDGRITWCEEYSKRTRCYIPFPPWHAAGLLVLGAHWSIFGEMIQVFHSPHLPPNAEAAMGVIKYGNVEKMLSPPSQLQDLVATEGGLEALSKLSRVGFAGGPLDTAAGDAISKCTTLHTLVGTTEANMPGAQYVENDHWNYTYFRPDVGVNWRDVGAGVFELVLKRDSKFDKYSSIFATFPQLDEFSTSDLYSKHPTEPNLWKYEGRTDDLIVFANAGKLNPLAYEEALRTNPHINAALVIGNGRRNPSVLLELAESIPTSLEKILETMSSIWHTIEAANAVSPKHGIISRSHILVARPNKPFLRTSKGTIRRQVTLTEYKNEIDELYTSLEEPRPLIEAMPAAESVNGVHESRETTVAA